MCVAVYICVCVCAECVKLLARIFLPRAHVFVCTRFLHWWVNFTTAFCILSQIISWKFAHGNTLFFSHQFLFHSHTFSVCVCLTLVVICILLSFMTLKTGITIKLQFVNCGVTRFQFRLFIPLILRLCITHTLT